MSIYIAASLNAKTLARDLRDKIEARGIQVTARWLDAETGYKRSDEALAEAAEMDFGDLSRSRVVIHAFPSIRSSGGGADSELGMAIALGKRVIVFGAGRTNIFHWMKGVRLAQSEEALLSLLED